MIKRFFISLLSTRDLQFALNEREVVSAQFLDPNETKTIEVCGPAWITVNLD